MNTLNKNSKALPSLLKIDHQSGINPTEDIQTKSTQRNGKLYATSEKSLLYDMSLLYTMYDLKIDELFV